jgi:hypothetical protein
MPTEDLTVSWQQPQFQVSLTPVDVTLQFNAAGAGPQGPTGAAGPIGATGPAGANGPPGTQGLPGPQGVPGPQGGPGPQGPQGIQGSEGPPGAGLVIKGTVPTSADLPTTGNTQGDLWIAADTGHGWTWQATPGPGSWTDVGQIQGPPGVAGPQGPTGGQGPAGAQGATGAAGPQGPTGPTGATGPQGPGGATGPAGAQGTPGVPMNWRGAWDPATAYAIGDAVQRNGSSYACIQANTAQDPAIQTTYWSLAAAQGMVGPTGAPGPTGPQGGTGAQGPTAVSANANNLATLGTDGLILVPASSIWSVRLRTFSSVGNSNFEVDQRNADGSVAVQSGFSLDRWSISKAGTMVISAQQNSASPLITVPGTNFAITRKFLRITLNTQEATLAAGDYFFIQHIIEGPQMRELINDVHSCTVLVRSSVANLQFGIALSDATASRSLTKLCAIPNANTITAIQLPNLPIFPTAGTFGLTPGSIGLQIKITLACGANYMSPANDTWQNGNFIGALGQSNFANSPVNSTFDIAFVQHEPGPICSTLIDKPFTQNMDECLRYFCKSYDYGTRPGTSGSPGGYKAFITNNSTSWCMGPLNYPKPLAKPPSPVNIYAPDGTAGAAALLGGGNVAIASIGGNGASGFAGLSFASVQTANTTWQFHYASDTGW